MEGVRVLIVEDDAQFTAAIRETLIRLGYDVIGTATTGEIAVQKAGSDSPDIVLMDILLGGDMDGVGAAEQIRSQYNIPVIFLTAYADPRTVHRAKLARPYGFLTKPVEERLLQATLELALHRYREESNNRSSWALSVLNGILEAVISADEKGVVSFMNPAAEMLTGWKQEEAKGKSLTEIFNVVRETSQGSTVITDSSVTKHFHDEAILLRKDGTRVPVEYSVGILKKQGTMAPGFVLVLRNVSERSRAEEALRESRRKYKELVNSIDGIVWEAEGTNHQFSFVSKQAASILGYSVKQWLEDKNFWQEHIHPEDRHRCEQLWQEAVGRKKSFEMEYRMIARDGRVVWLRDIVHFVPGENGKKDTLRGVLVDVTDLKKAEEALRSAHDELERRVEERTRELSQALEALKESEERYALAALGANDGLWDWDLRSNHIYYSPRWKSMLGFREEEISDNLEEWFGRVHQEDRERLRAEIATHLEGLTPHLETEHRMLHKDGTYRWILNRGVAVRDAEGRPYRMAGSQTDITERKIAEEQLLHDAFHDGLTNLFNRALFMDRLTGALARAKRRGDYFFAVLFLDLDRFKVVNDSLGHMQGDQLLIDFARRLETCIPKGDTVARLGGDEFAVLLEDIREISDAIRVAEKIQSNLLQPFLLRDREVFMTVSIGIAPFARHYERADDILRDADTAMYRAKAAGKACHQVFDRTMHTRAVALLQLETDLRRAVERNELRIYYQPIISIFDKTVKGFEALVRWLHPRRGLLKPLEFIPVAEETGLIMPIGKWILKEACNQIREWCQTLPPDQKFFISVNLSAKQLSPDLSLQVKQVLQETGIDPALLKLEITESVLMENAEASALILRQLRDLKVDLNIDDFGTGYSSLSYLHSLPVNTLKVDRSFVMRIGTSAENTEIIKTILALARNLGMEVVAEGVETQEQLDFLKELGCHYAQGYLFSHPLEASEVQGLIGVVRPV